MNDKRPTETLDEPVGSVAKRFLGRQLGLEQMATELGVSAKELAGAIRFIPALRELGLAGVPKGAQIKRETWETGVGLTMFQKVALHMRVGTPTSIVPPQR